MYRRKNHSFLYIKKQLFHLVLEKENLVIRAAERKDRKTNSIHIILYYIIVIIIEDAVS
jgi:hypothetical protein